MVDMTKEIWKDIDETIIEDLDPKYLGKYRVSNYGNVYSNFRGGRILSQSPGSRGKKERERRHVDNYQMPLRVGMAGKHYYVHRLVAAAFCPIPEGKDKKDLVVNHIDFNPHNNHADNLEWCTTLENVQWSYQDKKDTWSQYSTYEYMYGKRICLFDKEKKEFKGHFPSAAEAARSLHITDNRDMRNVSTSVTLAIKKNPFYYTAYSYYWIPIDVNKVEEVKTFEDAMRLYEDKNI